jgi:hypothetical protein
MVLILKSILQRWRTTLTQPTLFFLLNTRRKKHQELAGISTLSADETSQKKTQVPIPYGCDEARSEGVV